MENIRELIIRIRKANPKISRKELYNKCAREIGESWFLSNDEMERVLQELWERIYGI